VKAVRLPDDQAMVSRSNAELQRITDSLSITSNDYGMKINIKKTKVMRVCKTGGKKMKITINGQSGTSATVCKDYNLEYGIVCRRNRDVTLLFITKNSVY